MTGPDAKADLLTYLQGAGEVLLWKLKQLCNQPAHLLGDGSRLPGRSGKLASLKELCEEIAAEGDKALRFPQYAEFGRMLQPYPAARTAARCCFCTAARRASSVTRSSLVTAA